LEKVVEDLAKQHTKLEEAAAVATAGMIDYMIIFTFALLFVSTVQIKQNFRARAFSSV
jgi:hypothetical protein